MAAIKVTFEKATQTLAAGVRIECPGVNLSLTMDQAAALALAIQTKIRMAGNGAR